MTLDRKSGLMLVVLSVFSFFLTLYAADAYSVANYAFDDGSGGLWWLYTPPGSFLPWPRPPGMAAALSKGNGNDLFVYRYLIKPYVLAGVTALLWIVTALYVYRIVKGYQKTSHQKPSL